MFSCFLSSSVAVSFRVPTIKTNDFQLLPFSRFCAISKSQQWRKFNWFCFCFFTFRSTRDGENDVHHPSIHPSRIRKANTLTRFFGIVISVQFIMSVLTISSWQTDGQTACWPTFHLLPLHFRANGTSITFCFFSYSCSLSAFRSSNYLRKPYKYYSPKQWNKKTLNTNCLAHHIGFLEVTQTCSTPRKLSFLRFRCCCFHVLSVI